LQIGTSPRSRLYQEEGIRPIQQVGLCGNVYSTATTAWVTSTSKSYTPLMLITPHLLPTIARETATSAR